MDISTAYKLREFLRPDFMEKSQDTDYARIFTIINSLEEEFFIEFKDEKIWDAVQKWGLNFKKIDPDDAGPLFVFL